MPFWKLFSNLRRCGFDLHFHRKLVVIDITDRAKEGANSTSEAEDIERWISANGDIPAGSIVALRSGWAARVKSPSFRNDNAGNLPSPVSASRQPTFCSSTIRSQSMSTRSRLILATLPIS
ncbi:cyclase family protein, partial [Agrobacterium tumefaciens]|uniref:cyclase family protein n=1 Tax=Agrobacterium tumefaciens TaxID=358 RepID=UPI001FCAEB5A